jgi:predicted ATPase/transcriptional regulator with XRE-family HTH domain
VSLNNTKVTQSVEETLAEVSFGEWLKRQRGAEGLTQEQLALQINCSTSALRKFESEERHPSAQIAQRLAEIFNVPKNERTAFLRFTRGDWKYAPGGTIEDAPWRVSTKSSRSNIPATTTSLIGREQQITDIRGHLLNIDIRLVTLIGPPGIGKTRLSIESARASLSDFSDGVFFVALASLDDASLVPFTIVQSLGYVEAKDKSAMQQLIEGIGDKQMLLVLDNLEHIIEDSAPLASGLLSACPRLKILTTSREALRISGEWLYPVPSLHIPKENSFLDLETAAQFPSLTLFVERARAVRSDFLLNEGNVRAIASICAQLDGLPLAIELIAARMRLMSPQALLERLNSQYVLSADGMRAESARQKTLDNAISWSYNLLPPDEQKLFAGLSVFVGGFTLEAAESIFSPLLPGKAISNLIALLVDKSLLQGISDKNSELRYDMLVTIRQFALNNLRRMGNESDVRNRHLAYFCRMAEQARSHLRSSQQLVWLDRLETEHDNIRAVLNWAQDSGAIRAGLHLATDLEMFWIYRAYLREPCLTLENLLAKSLPDDDIQVLARGHFVTGLLQMMLGNLVAGHAHGQESERLCLQLGPTSKADLADARNLLIYNNPIHMRQGYEENLKLFQEAGDQWQIAHTIYNIGEVLQVNGDFAGARQAYERSLALFQACGDNIRVAQQNRLLASIAFEEGKYAEARTNYEEALSFYRHARFNLEIHIPLYKLGTIAIREKDFARAKARFSECLVFNQKFVAFSLLVECLIGFASIANAEEDFERAAQLLGAAGAEKKARQTLLGSFERAEFDRNIQVGRNQLGEDGFTVLEERGQAMTMEQAIVYALDV